MSEDKTGEMFTFSILENAVNIYRKDGKLVASVKSNNPAALVELYKVRGGEITLRELLKESLEGPELK